MKFMPSQSAHAEKSLAEQIEGEVYGDRHRRLLYATDASIYQIEPRLVVAPKSPHDVVVAHQFAAEQRLAIIPRGSGTSLSGQSIGAGLVLDFSKYLNRIIELDPTERIARVEPGLVLDGLNAAAAAHGLQFGPDVATSSRATLGGMIGNNSAGSRSLLQGKTVDHVLELVALLADGTSCRFAPRTGAEINALLASQNPLRGAYECARRIAREEDDEILERFPAIVRRVSGYNLDELVFAAGRRLSLPVLAASARQREQERYPQAESNLAKLLVGAEGSLATVTQAVLHLAAMPVARGVVVLHFDSLAHAVASTHAVLECQPSAAELFDGLILRLAEQSLEYRHYLDFVIGRPQSLMLVEVSGDSSAEVAAKANAVLRSTRDLPGLVHTLSALEPKIYQHVWACRKAALPLLMGIPGARKPVAFVEDTAVDPAKLPEFVERFEALLERHGTTGAFYGHASVGCLHIRPLLDLSAAEDVARLQKISADVATLVEQFDGAMSGEHGDGLARSYLNERLFGPRLYRVFRELKAAFDPDGRMNPGKVISNQGPTENLRLGVEYAPLPIVTAFNFSREGGLAAAAELCNGSGVCRKTQTGTMCPSFMATGEEEHSTRGRANALRSVLSGRLPKEALTSREMFATFDLCLSCKGCKAECPSNVDVAKMKMEFLAHYRRRHGTPLSAWALGHAATLNRWGSALAPLSNWLARAPFAPRLLQAALGLDRRRPLPSFAPESFQAWHRKYGKNSAGSKANAPNRGPIVLLDDCLTSYCEPGINRHAYTLLSAAGYDVQLASLECCGRTLVSQGLVDEAKRLVTRNLQTLKPYLEQGVQIVGCEPSCILMLADEYRDLSNDPLAEAAARLAMPLDTYLVRSGVADALVKLSQNGQAPAQSVLLHGHCHQKALVGLQDTQTLLSKLVGDVRTVDAGCCGMAGSFGYEHYDLSMKIAERRLLPEVRSAANHTIVAPGFSCRQQILHGTGRAALHPVELIPLPAVHGNADSSR